ncbi:MerR family transcriptional regulator [Staphylococcus succinus]|uniref:MerR family transcriptional regulator n=1 Tax=Staphylococcus succinus TaxID=61015 RepID=A0A9Q6HMV3_9STAP|nr:MerR family transcriptional regulator [Staphylococcus succinus]MBU0438683.1 MerR family transcriptional regulator [Staphylococcus succinus]MEB8210389.1 MerR family transcriptional regulator [Staphylococcus succinus]PTI43810.1 MerR family transcriptional regulator [Staphylococcus succinus]PTI70308.1 MerR family transcriptional regulator [Staphylococcus succinus]PTI74465.1 MerR family transcriptional regulator [Staphylococcus succinus]
MLISEVSQKMEISIDTLRYYEKIGIIPQISRTNGGVRNYTEDDLNWINLAKCMRQSGLSIEALAHYLELFQQGEDTQAERLAILSEQRETVLNTIQQMNDTLELLNKKIDNYETVLKPREEALRQ